MISACKKEKKEIKEIVNNNCSCNFEKVPEIDSIRFVNSSERVYKLLNEEGIITSISDNLGINSNEIKFKIIKYKGINNIYLIKTEYYTDTTNYEFYTVYVPYKDTLINSRKILYILNKDKEIYNYYQLLTNKLLFTIVFYPKQNKGELIEYKESPFDVYFDRCMRKQLKEMWNNAGSVMQFASCPPCYMMGLAIYCATKVIIELS